MIDDLEEIFKAQARRVDLWLRIAGVQPTRGSIDFYIDKLLREETHELLVAPIGIERRDAVADMRFVFTAVNVMAERLITGGLDAEGVNDDLKAALLVEELMQKHEGLLMATVGVMGLAAREQDALDHQAVIDSNFTKFCKDEAEIEATIEHYWSTHRINVIPGETIDGLTAILCNGDQTGTDGKFYPDGKVLKSINYKPPVFTD
jgi:hypothetical protein